jgi:cysteine desulfurase/selenocysteine lyase
MIMDKMGVAVRTGTHCAEPIMTHYGVTGMVRASFAMYNTEEEVELLYKAVAKAVSMLR